MSGLRDKLLQPYYVQRPGFVLSRLRRGDPRGEPRLVELPWGLQLQIQTRESIGRTIYRNGVFDLTVTEVLLRLTEPQEVTVDVGANIGYMSSVLASRAARVVAFEPHPELFAELKANIARWGRRVEPRNLALSDQPGTLTLGIDVETFAHNRGSASITAGGSGVEVTVDRLDEQLADEGEIGVLKVDVEGHEAAVLRGSTALLEARAVRDIVFEDHEGYPTPTSVLLEDAGYTVIGLGRTFSGLVVGPPGTVDAGDGADPSFLATLDPERARRLLDARGWRALRG